MNVLCRYCFCFVVQTYGARIHSKHYADAKRGHCNYSILAVLAVLSILSVIVIIISKLLICYLLGAWANGGQKFTDCIQKCDVVEELASVTSSHFDYCCMEGLTGSDILVLKLISVLVFILFSNQNFYFI